MKQLKAFLKIFIDLYQFFIVDTNLFLSLSIVFNTYEWRKTFSAQNHRTLRIFSTGVADSEEEQTVSQGPSSVFLKDKDSTHIFNNKEQNCMECKLDDLPLRHMPGHCLLEDLPPLVPDEDQSSIIFGSEKDQ